MPILVHDKNRISNNMLHEINELISEDNLNLILIKYEKPQTYIQNLFGMNFFKSRQYQRSVMKPKISMSARASMHSYDTSEHFLDVSSKLSSAYTPSRLFGESIIGQEIEV